MTGDGTNDAPALAQADVGVAMNSGTQAAKEAGNMVDLDSNPTKLIEIVEIGKQLLMTRGALTTFSIANDVAKYFAIIPAMFAGAFPVLNALNIMHLAYAAVGHSVGGDLQRAHHHRADPAGSSGREVRTESGRSAAAPESADLRRGRRHRSLYRHQGHRSFAGCDAHGMTWPIKTMRNNTMNTAVTTSTRYRVRKCKQSIRCWRTSILFTLLIRCCLELPTRSHVTAASGALFPHKAAGSLIERNGQVIGSGLLAQGFASDRYFHSRPSAAGNGYDATSSGGSNLAQSNTKLVQRMQGDIDKLCGREAGPSSADRCRDDLRVWAGP